MIEDVASARRSATDAVTTLQAHLELLLACADVLASHGAMVPSRELQRTVMRALVAVRMMREDLLCIEIIERVLCSMGASLPSQQLAAVHVEDFPRLFSRSRRGAEMSKLEPLGDAAGVTQPGQAGADRPEHAEELLVSDGLRRAGCDQGAES